MSTLRGGAVVARQADENSHPNRNGEHHQRAMLDLVRQAAQRVIAELCCLAADFRRCLAADFRDLIAHRIGPALQSVGHALQCGNDGLADPVSGLRGVCGGAAADALELALQRTQALVDCLQLDPNSSRLSCIVSCIVFPVSCFVRSAGMSSRKTLRDSKGSAALILVPLLKKPWA